MLAAGFSAQDLLPGFEACKLAVEQEQRVRYSHGPNHHSVTAASVFIRFLQHKGELPLPATPPSGSELWPLLGEFRSWMRKHRGLTDTTLDVYEGILTGLLDTLGDEVRDYSAEALRAFVRFLGVTGRCPPGMEHAIPGFASWQLTSVPRFLVAEEVQRVIDSCNDYLFGIRDRAVLLLLARLGLRASEVAQLKFVDIDWRNGRITVCGKGRRQDSLPLPQ